ncbi:glycosyltransferase family 2 protein [Gelatiniphilus marinus]|uniref:Glycosyltransferase n=1 Tax=Gelatiniphilus marinus TaxID=1759464 RepID=A0ABW5JVG1_9FLAO
MVLISILIAVLYLLLIGSFVLGFDKVPVFMLKDIKAKTTFSVIIPFRNEAENLPHLLASIDALAYPNHLYEIILVDDESGDDSVEIIKKNLDTIPIKNASTRTNISIIKNNRTSNSPKKDAITTAIKQAKHNWIITTDADCILPKYWLNSFDEFIQTTTSKCIIAPVTYTSKHGFLNRFQLLDMLSLQAATIGSFGIKKPFMCNGANFAYKKALFLELNGFDGNNNIASGDDIFLLEKAVKTHPKNVNYLKCEHAIVTTKTQPTWSKLKVQRIRWAAKTSAYNNMFGKLTGLLVLLTNTLIISLLLLVLLSAFNLKIFVFILIIKWNIDFYLIYKSASFFNQKKVLKTYVFGFLLYPLFSVFIAFVSLFKGYKWKGRHFKS